ncbi:hypothetical protein GQ44DRAFT_786335 [Phaeosphaeriaceae sp. PMI808]|nr:hypothetical protein GQ44DRAFT_786335 [Phaeosphaeriaceae sp. PMI808]
MCAQLALIAVHGGRIEQMSTAYIPSFVGELRIWYPEDQNASSGIATATGARHGLRGAHAQVQLVNQMSQQVMLDITDIRCTSYSNESRANDASLNYTESPYTRLVWKPYLERLNIDQARALFPPTKTMEGMENTFTDIDPPSMTLEPTGSSSSERLATMTDLSLKHQEIVEVSISKYIFENMESILSGTKSSLELVRQNDWHSQMYNSGLGMSAAYTQLERVINLLSHDRLGMSILEIGAGTGGATRVVLKWLQGTSSLQRYKTYTFTDVSSGYFLEAQKEFAEYHGLNFGVLDIEQAPNEQGYEGKRQLVETPFLPIDEWHLMLQRTGFSGIDISLDDYDQPYTMVSTFISTAVESGDFIVTPTPSIPSNSPSIHIVSLSKTYVNSDLDFHLARNDGSLRIVHLAGYDAIPKQSQVIVLYDSTKSLTHDVSLFNAAEDILQNSRSVLWINIHQNTLNSFSYAGEICGLLRVMTSENPSITYASISVTKDDLQDAALMHQITRLQAQFLSTSTLKRNTEFMVTDGILHISRLIPDKVLNERSSQRKNAGLELLPIGDQAPLTTDFTTPGILSSLYFKEDKSFWQPLCDHQVEVRICAVGVNWKDLAVSAGRLDLDSFSSECAGTITKLGKRVTAFQVGDRVFGVSKGRFGQYMRCHESLIQHMDGHNFVEMAVLPIVSMTALYALCDLAHVEPGEKVLIQSASGGLGIAAINLARHLGADVWATVVRLRQLQSLEPVAGLRALFNVVEYSATFLGTDEKRDFLRDNFGFSEGQIFSSRERPAPKYIMHATGGSGFDVILSAASGEHIDEWMRILRPSTMLKSSQRQSITISEWLQGSGSGFSTSGRRSSRVQDSPT